MTLKTEISANNLSYVKINGSDAETFLQGQVTVNLSTLSDGDIRYCAQCNAKGKLVGLGFLLYQNNDYYFIQSSSGVASSLAQFKKFGVFAQVEFSLPEQSTYCLGVACQGGSPANYTNDKILFTPPLPGATKYSLMWISASQSGSLSISVEDPKDSSEFEAYLIQQGVALLNEHMVDQWVPQMLNVQALNGIDFDKGCYMGQEVVARTRYLGKNKRALYTFTLGTDLLDNQQIVIDSPVYWKMGENWRKSGTVINHVTFQDCLWLSVVLPNDVTEQDSISVDDAGKILLSPCALPYVIELEESSIKKRK